MAAKHGHDTHEESKGHDPHDEDHEEEEEDIVRTPMWLPFVGMGLLLVGALGTYLWVYPGRLNTRPAPAAESSDADAGAPSGAPTPAPAAPAAPAH